MRAGRAPARDARHIRAAAARLTLRATSPSVKAMPAARRPSPKSTKTAPRAASGKVAHGARAEAKPSHLDEHGRARMVDVGAKDITQREATARGRVFMHAKTLALLQTHAIAKGDVLTVAQIAAIQAAKRCSELIPLTHSIPLEGIDVRYDFDPAGPSLAIEARVATNGRTGVEMEALTAVAVAALTVYDMMKAVDRGMVIGEIALWEKKGGKSGTWRRDDAAPGSTSTP